MNHPIPAPYAGDKIVHFIGAATFGGPIELIQPSFNRSADVNDWVADIFGVVLGIGRGLYLGSKRVRVT